MLHDNQIKNKLFSVFLFVILFSVSYTKGQIPKTKDFYAIIKKYDVNKLWISDSLLVMDHDFDSNGKSISFEPRKIGFPEPFGFIGSNYQRFYIHFLSVSKSKNDPYKYIVSGKTKVKNNICSFKGTIAINKSILYEEQDDKRFIQGSVYGVYKFYEDSSQPSSGYITGVLKTDFYLDNKQQIFYDDLNLIADDYCNNQFTGTWKSYKIKSMTKKCHWGDFRIPGCGDLDNGAGDFGVNNKYRNNGWQSYMQSTGGVDSTTENKARDAENEKWWK